jgi:hypothetical protein
MIPPVRTVTTGGPATREVPHGPKENECTVHRIPGQFLCSKEWSGAATGCNGQVWQMRLRHGRVLRLRSNLPAGTDEVIAQVEIESCIGFE